MALALLYSDLEPLACDKLNMILELPIVKFYHAEFLIFSTENTDSEVFVYWLGVS